MIGERTAGVEHAGPLAKGRRSRLRDRLSSRPALSGRELLARAMGNGVAVQLALAMTLVAFAALMYLIQASQASVLEMNIGDLQAAQTQLRMDNASLHATATSLQSLQRVDAIATNQLHMARPDLSNTIWIRPVTPRLGVIRAVNADTVEAQRQSQPLAWMRRAIAVVRSSL